MRFLGIDYGRRHVGLAISNDEATIAFPFKVITQSDHLISEIERICKEESVFGLVVGRSVDDSGQPNPVMSDIESFYQELTDRLGRPVFWESEFGTSQRARELYQGRARVDSAAAALILQDFLDREGWKSS